MEVFRIARETHSNQLTASGRSGRWNKDDEFVLYTGSSRSLSSLELVVRRNAIEPDFIYKVMIISISDEEDIYTPVLKKDLPDNWRSTKAYSIQQLIGSKWYHEKQSLILKVPSAVIPQEYNYIININHPDFKDKVALIRTEDYFWDDRLL